MKNKKILALVMCLVGFVNILANGRPGHPPKDPAPIDTNEFILIIAAVLLTVGVMAYKKLSLKKSLISF